MRPEPRGAAAPALVAEVHLDLADLWPAFRAVMAQAIREEAQGLPPQEAAAWNRVALRIQNMESPDGL